MFRKGRIGLLPNDTAELLARITECRRAAMRARTEYPINCPEYDAAGEVMGALDRLAGLLRGGQTEPDSRDRSAVRRKVN